MQLVEEKRIVSRKKKWREIPPLHASIGVPDQLVKIGVVKTMPVKFEKKVQREAATDFSSWNMPEQETGVIKCREHDFL